MGRRTVPPLDARRMILDGTATPNMVVDGSLYLFGCTRLTALPEGLSVTGSLYLDGCHRLTALPSSLSVGDSLDLSNCTRLTALPSSLSVGGSLYLDNCTSLTALPQRITIGGHTGRMIAHSLYPLIWDGKRYHAGCRHFTWLEALEHWGDEKRTDSRARIFYAAIRAHQQEITA